MQVTTHISLNKHLLYFLPIIVSFLTYLVIFIPDKTLLIFQLSLAYPCHVCISPLSTFNKLYPFIFYRHYTMAEYAFFVEKVDMWRKDMVSLWGNLNICPQLHWLELPCHTQAELSSISSLKVWREIQKPHHDIAYLLVWVEDAMGDRHYGISVVWANPNQVRAASMEEAVEMLTTCTSSGTNWPYILAWLYKGTSHMPLPQGWALGCPTLERGRGGPLWVDQPTQGLPTPCCWPPRCLPCRLEWAGWAHYYLRTRATGQQCKPYHMWVYLPGDWYPFTPSGETGPKGSISWQGLHHPVSQFP